MSRAGNLLWILVAFAAPAACATTRLDPAAASAAETERTINTLRAQNNSYVRQIEELQNRVFILEDRLDSQRVTDQQRGTPSLPAVKVLRADPKEPEGNPPPPVVMEPTVSEAPPASELVAGDAPVEYAGEAARPAAPGRPMLRAQRGVGPSPRLPAPRPVAPRAIPVATAPVPPPAPRAEPPVLPPTLIREGTEPREPIPPEPLRIYRDALEALRAGHHAAALAGFRRFLDRYPVHDYADNAQYWIGECYYDLRQYQAATREFRAVVERYPHGNKVPDALLKLGFSHLALNQAADGRQILESLLRAFPRHPTAALATARLHEPPFAPKVDVSLGTIAPRIPAERR
ncbi:MAG TPA: tol-pal system protein YbgF [Polyangia bacterium]|nr:tol-pal system protein YbgF [Polyangia bacterium]